MSPARLIFVFSLLGIACAPGEKTARSGDVPAIPAEALAVLDTATLMHHIRALSDDSMLGRAPGSLGEERTVAYLEGQFRSLGLAPGNPDGTYIQNVPLVAITADPTMVLTVRGRGAARPLRYRDDFVAWTRHVSPAVTVDNAELVFVGYGTEAPEFSWDDFKGQDLSGKILVMLVNDPQLADTTQFRGKAMTYYGRWTYKFEQGMKHKAAGVLLVHEAGPAGYPWPVVQGMGGEKFDLATPDSNRTRAPMEGWLHLDQAKALLRLAGQDFDSLKARATTREFTPLPLGLTASVRITNQIRSVSSRNVVARLAGSGPEAGEHVVYTAHWDHFGVSTPVGGDSIYNGALDNASGTAALLLLAQAFKAMPATPRRSILFLAVTAEEQGLLGSQYYSVMPLYPLATTLANINIDGLNTEGATKDLVVVGMGASELEDYAQAAASEQGRILKPDPESEKGFYYRSDHFNFAKQGVPAFYADAGVDVIGKPADFAMTMRAKYTNEDYHKPSDEIKPDWNLMGSLDDIRLYLAIGYRVAQADKYPEWRVGNEFRATREAMRKP